jgi:hypothetical protein
MAAPQPCPLLLLSWPLKSSAGRIAGSARDAVQWVAGAPQGRGPQKDRGGACGGRRAAAPGVRRGITALCKGEKHCRSRVCVKYVPSQLTSMKTAYRRLQMSCWSLCSESRHSYREAAAIIALVTVGKQHLSDDLRYGVQQQAARSTGPRGGRGMPMDRGGGGRRDMSDYGGPPRGQIGT